MTIMFFMSVCLSIYYIESVLRECLSVSLYLLLAATPLEASSGRKFDSTLPHLQFNF